MKIIPVILLLVFSCAVCAQELKEKYAEADGFRQKYEAGYFGGNITPRWIGNTHFCWYAVKTPAGTDFILVNAGKRQKQPAFDQKAMAKALTAELGRKVEPGKMPFREIVFSDDLKQLTFVTEGMKYTYDRNKNKVIGKVKEEPRRREGHWGGVNEENWQGATPSPDGKKEAFVSEGNLFVRDISSGKVNRLSYDGAPGEYYSSFISWSPDSRKLVSCKYRPAWIRKLKTVVSSPAGQLQPKMEEIDYVKPGDALPVKRPVLFLVEEGRQVNIEFAEPEKQFNLNNIRWADDSRSFTFDYNKRGHQEYIVYKVTGDNPKAQVLIGEKMPTFVYYNLLYRYDLKDRNEILWISERDGWRHLYLYDADNGQVKRQLTKGEWVVKRVLHVDDAARVVYLVGCGKDAGEDPYLEKVYRLNIENGELLCLTPENGNHQVEFSRDYTYFTDSWSRIDCPPVAALRSAKDGSVLLSLEKADISKMLAEGWRMPEVFCAKGRDGETDIWGVIVRPVDFDPSKKYPVIEYIYAGPHDSFVPKSFTVSPVDAALAQLGFIVVQIDGMGTANRSKKFHDVCWKNLKDGGFPDRIAWMKAAAAKYPEMDIDRVGIYGCSAGGQNAMGAVLFHPDFYKVSVAACGCHDNRMDKIWWNEQWMGYPVGKEYEEWRTATENFLSYAEYAVTLPPIKMKRNDTLSFVDIEEGDRLVFQAKYNGILQRTIFDTGVGPYCVLSRKLADGMGVRYDSIDENKVTINEDLISVRSIIDSIEVGNITFYNIPAFIYSDTASVPFVSGSSIKRRKKRKKAQTVVDSVRTLFTDCVSLGLPVMKLIGKIQTDYEHNKMCFPVSVANAHLPKAPNIYAYKYDLYMRIKLNGVAFTANLDTGSNEYVTVDSAFYEKHQKELPIASTCKKNTFGVVMLHQARAITYKTLKDPAIIFDDKLMQPPGPEAVKTYPLGQIVPGIFFDGVIGNGFYRRIGKKVLLDLDNMRLEAVQ